MLSHRLRSVREMSGLSARAASALAGLSASHVGLIEAGTMRVSVDTASALARLFGVTLDWLVSGDGRAPSARVVRAAVEKARAQRADDSGEHAAVDDTGTG